MIAVNLCIYLTITQADLYTHILFAHSIFVQETLSEKRFSALKTTYPAKKIRALLLLMISLDAKLLNYLFI